MFKKLFVLAAGLLACTSAFADYILYEFAPDSPVSGYFVQHEDDGSIAHFSLFMVDAAEGIGVQYFPFFGDGAVNLTGASTRFGSDGPTNFTLYSDYGGTLRSIFGIDFRRNALGGYDYTAVHETSLWYWDGWSDFAGTVTGSLVRGVMFEGLAQELDSYGGYYPGIPTIVPVYLGPQEVPEPAGLALFAAGAATALGAARRRKKLGATLAR